MKAVVTEHKKKQAVSFVRSRLSIRRIGEDLYTLRQETEATCKGSEREV